MSAKFPEYKGLDLPKVAEEILNYWQEQNVFEKSVTTREGHKPFVFFEGPPSANGLPGVHHVLARAIKDIFPRYKTMKGYQVKRKAGWDTHGLPIELGVEKELGITKEDIGKTISVEDYNAACRKAVMRYTDVWNDLTQKMGYWVDMDDPYITYEPKYMESVWWLLKQIYDKNLLYKGYTIQPYSPKAGTGLSSHELNQPGTYQDVTDTTVVAQFKANKSSLPKFLQNEGDVYFLAWTTTPWTLPSNTALTVGPKIEYVLVETYNQYTFEPIKVVLAKKLVGYQFSGKFHAVEDSSELEAYQPNDKKIPYRIIKEFIGKDLVGITYEQLLPYALPYDNPEHAFRVISGDFVTTEDGTGIVHTAPTFGADDALVAKQAKPEVPPMLVKDENGNLVPLVNLQGKFRPEMGEFAGKYVKNEYYVDGEAPERSVDVELAIKLKEEKLKGNVILRTVKDIGMAIKEMPLQMKQLIPVMFFSWYAMFCYWMYLTSALSLNFFNTLDENSIGFKQAQVITGQVNGSYNIITFLVAFALVPLARKIGAKGVHFFSLLVGGIGVFSIPYLGNDDVLFTFPNLINGGMINIPTLYLFTFGLGLTWASMMSMPYQLLAGAVPKEKTGIYMGIFNMFIVVPMIIQIFSVEFFVYDFLGSNPINIIKLAGIFLILGGICTLFIKVNNDVKQ